MKATMLLRCFLECRIEEFPYVDGNFSRGEGCFPLKGPFSLMGTSVYLACQWLPQVAYAPPHAKRNRRRALVCWA